MGVAALMIATKYEEIYPPTVKDLVYITDNAYSKNDIRKFAKCQSLKLRECLIP